MNITCTICMESITTNGDKSTTPCGHLFHTECINNWLRSDVKSCPQCRKSCRNNQIIKLFFSEDFEPKANHDQIELDEIILKVEIEANNFKLREADLLNQLTEANKKWIPVQEKSLKMARENHALIKQNIELTEKVDYLQRENDILKRSNGEKTLTNTQRIAPSPNSDNQDRNNGNPVNIEPEFLWPRPRPRPIGRRLHYTTTTTPSSTTITITGIAQ